MSMYSYIRLENMKCTHLRIQSANGFIQFTIFCW